MVHRTAGLTIRPLSGSDLSQISALIRNTLLVSNLRDYSLETVRAVMASFSTEALKELARHREMFVCVEERRLSGVVGLEREEVYSFFVAPDRQGQGVGRALLGFVEDRARQRGASRLKVSASLTAVGFYEHLRYRRTGFESDGRYGRTVELVKTL
jgi:GNAT superfamily N-acetyltransferase